MALMLCLVSIACFGQYEINHQEINEFSDTTVYKVQLLSANTKCPYIVEQNWEIGHKCYVSGAWIFTVGTISSIVGGAFMLADKSIDGMKIGTGFLSAGGTLIGVSIPLLCFGDHIERETTMIQEVWESLAYKQEYNNTNN